VYINYLCVASFIRKKLALTSLTSGGRLVGIVRLRTEATEFFYPVGTRARTGNVYERKTFVLAGNGTTGMQHVSRHYTD
jgi:hypothetical protein